MVPGSRSSRRAFSEPGWPWRRCGRPGAERTGRHARLSAAAPAVNLNPQQEELWQKAQACSATRQGAAGEGAENRAKLRTEIDKQAST